MRLEGKKVLVTGGTGFIGSNLVRRLLSAGCQTFVLTRQGVLDEKFRLWYIEDQIVLLEGDLRNYDDLLPLENELFDVVFHLAAYNRVDASFSRITEVFEVNCLGSANIIRATRNCKKFVHVSSSEVYGNRPNELLNENSQCFPVSPYGISKLSGEKLVKCIAMKNETPLIIIRPFNNYGPFQSSRAIIPELVMAALQNRPLPLSRGTQVRDFLFVDDTVEGLISAASLESGQQKLIILASGKSLSTLKLTEMILGLTKSKSKVILGSKPERPTDIEELRGDPSLAGSVLAWSARTGLEEGLQRTISWIQEFMLRKTT